MAPIRLYYRSGPLIGGSQEWVARAIRLRRMTGDVGVSPTVKFPLLLARACLRNPLSPAWERARVRGLAVNCKSAECIRSYRFVKTSPSRRSCPIEGEKGPWARL